MPFTISYTQPTLQTAQISHPSDRAVTLSELATIMARPSTTIHTTPEVNRPLPAFTEFGSSSTHLTAQVLAMW